jgi:hypothetical protein
MKDIDFDELDKAVNSLMGGLKSASDQPAAKTLNIASTLKDDEKPEYTKLEQVAKQIGSETILPPTERTAVLSEDDIDGKPQETTVELAISSKIEATPAPEPAAPQPVQTAPVLAPPPPRPRIGRFMDVMHPSSDMKTPGSNSNKATNSSEKPISDISHVGTLIEEPIPETAVLFVEPAPAPEPTPELIEPAPVVSSLEEIVTPEPQSSPFLPDAKVEKRPLGGAVLDPFSNDGPSEPVSVIEKDAQLAPDATVLAEQLPEELHGDLLAIETNLADESVALPEADQQAPNDAVETDKTTATGPASIAQQYKELPSSGDQSNGAIYDVDSYHKSVAHPAKSPSGWLWIIAIIVIVIICGAGAAAFYILGMK